MPRASKSDRKLSYRKCKQCRFDKAKVTASIHIHPTMWIEAEFDSSACPKIGSGPDLVVCDANTSTIPVQKAVQKPKRSWPIVILLSQAEMHLIEGSRDRKTSIVRIRSNRPLRNIRG